MRRKLMAWKIEIEELRTMSRVGIWAHEVQAQPLLINMKIKAIAPALPESIADCLDYEPICRWVTEEWPEMPHTALLETRVGELMKFIFSFDQRVESVDLLILKPQAINQARGAGVRAELTRHGYEAAFGCLTSHRDDVSPAQRS